MTEPNSVPAAAAAAEPFGAPTETPTGAAPARVDWPAPASGAVGPDPDVERLLDRLGTLPDLPVSGHGEVYAGLHHDLKEALNEAGDTAS